jgi:glycerol-3-phosphate acyltransferase PlsY
MIAFLRLSIWGLLFTLITGYLMGSIPSGILFARMFGLPDPREHGSTHTGATNVMRQGNLLAGLLTGLLDLIKGILAIWLVQQIFPSPWVIPLAGAAALIGHCWPIFADFRGGMGIATTAGLALVYFPVVIPIFAILYFAVNYLMRHQARTIMVIAAFLPLMLIPFRYPPEKVVLASGLAIVLVIRWAHDFYRIYD